VVSARTVGSRARPGGGRRRGRRTRGVRHVHRVAWFAPRSAAHGCSDSRTIQIAAIAHMVDAQLISMPFGHIFSPSIGLSLIRAQLLRHNLTCDVLYLTLPFAELIGKNLYASFANDHRGSLRDFAGEWIFSDALFDRPRSAEQAYIKEILIGRKAW